MKAVVTATGPTLDAALDPRFGRCGYFILVELDDLTFKAVENDNTTRSGGAGIQSARWVADQGAGIVLTGNCGPNAYQTLSAAGIQIVTGCSGTVRDAIERYKTGQTTMSEEPNVKSHFGMGRGGGRGRQ